MNQFGLNKTLTLACCTCSAVDIVEHMVHDVTHCSHPPFPLRCADQNLSAFLGRII